MLPSFNETGNSVFVDGRFQAYAAEWAYLASITRMAPSVVEDLAREATSRGLVVGLRLAQSVDDEEAAPWMRRPSRRPPHLPVAGPLPREVHAVLAQRLFVEKADLPSPVLN